MTVPFLPRLEKEAIREDADALRFRYGFTNLPIDVELLIEKLGIRLSPLSELGNYSEGGACITRDWHLLYYDDGCSNQRLRFSLAHETGHYILHRDIIDQLPPTRNIEEWCTLLLGLPEPFQQSLEWQAHYFASCLLIPQRTLLERFDNLVAQIEPRIYAARAAGLQRHQYMEFASQWIAARLSKVFDVSLDAAYTRMEMDGLLVDIP